MNLMQTLVMFAAMLILVDHSLLAEPPKPPTAPRPDLYGEPLPEGAIARMGTTRFRHDANSVAYLDAKTLVTAGDGVRLWDIATWKMIREWKAEHFGGDRLAALSGNGRVLISVTKQLSLRIWDTATGKLMAERQKNATKHRGDAIVKLVVSRDGKRFASVREVEHAARVWSLEQEKELCKISLPTGTPFSPLAMSESGERIGGGSDRVWFWNSATGKLLESDEPGVGMIMQIVYSADESRTCIVGESGIIIRDSAGKQVTKIKRDMIPPAAFFSVDSRKLFLAGVSDPEFRVAEVHAFDATSGKRTSSWSIPLNCISAASAVSPDSRILATAGLGSIYFWNLADGKEINRSPGHPNTVCTTCITPDGRYVASTDFYDRDVRLWEIATGKEVRRFRGHEKGCVEIVFSPDGKLLASSSYDKTVRVWDTASGREVAKLDQFAQPIWHLRFGADNSTLAVTPYAVGEITLFNVKSKKTISSHSRDQNLALSTLIRHPDGRLLAISQQFDFSDKASPNRVAVVVWDVRANRPVQRFEGLYGTLTCAVLSPDGRTLATRASDGAIHFWEMATGRQQIQIDEGRPSGQPGTQFFAFSPDGTTIASACQNEPRIYLWNVATGKLISSFPAHSRPMNTVEYTPDGKTLVTGSQDSTLMSWDMTLPNRHGELPVVALTEQERAKHWDSLAGSSKSAFLSMWAFVADRGNTVKFFKDKFAPVQRIPPEMIQKWLADLDSPQFAVREKADRNLLANVDQAEPELRGALENGLGAEGRKRAHRILEVQASAKLSPDQLREIRAVEALEKMGTPEARELLRSLTRGNYRPRTIREAELTLKRIGK